ncbi:acyltransferase family protein [Demequina zhanjiangensis]|uniref:Acyltransferase n=1 Tax=Demequina zhanjiangensis TaxID=3051659 RepID=A0ABT8FZD4_9MICO|nr:acyltransferase [Demequina sp. SYSU T00b26]MDN4472261.1 acyltransferase [Demequina sp. SYSU T00b26]
MSVETTHRTVPTDRPAAAVGARFAGLEGYRGLAALAIVIYHVYQHVEAADPGSLGAQDSASYIALHGLDGLVSLFFVLSAFLLFLPYARAVLGDADSPSARAFLVRRAARIVPLYLVAILVVWSARNTNLPGAYRDLIEHLLFIQNYDNTYIFSTIGPAWSLAVEVQFYVLLALLGAVLVWAARRLTRRGGLVLLTTVVSVMFLGSLAYKLASWLMLGTLGDDWKVWFGLPAKLDEFALGMGLAIVVAVGRARLGRVGVEVTRFTGLAVVVASFILRPEGAGNHAWFHTGTALGFALMLAASVLGPGDWWTTALGRNPLAFLGLISYSLYLWHEPLMLLLDSRGLLPGGAGFGGFGLMLLVVLPLAILAAWLSYQLIERPGNAIRGLIDRQGRSRDYYDGE